MSMVSRTSAFAHPLQQLVTEQQNEPPRSGAALVHDSLGRAPRSQSLSFSAAETAQRLTSTLLSKDERHARSDRFEMGSSSSAMAAQLHPLHIAMDVAHLEAAVATHANPPHVAIDMTRLEAAAQQSPAERIRSALRSMEFKAPAGPEREAQQALEARYVDWAAGVLQARERTFGNGRYSIDSDRKVSIGDAVLPALYDGVRQFLSSSSRSPVAGALATALGPRFSGTDSTGQRVNQGEMNNSYDPAVVGGAIGGATALAMDSTLLNAMDRRARLANFPQLAPVDLKALVPDPAFVQLRVVDGKKEYWVPLADNTNPASSPDVQTMAALQEEVEQKRQRLATVQNALQGQGWGLLAQPLVTGAANVLRRYFMPAKSLLQAGPVMAGSVLASGAAGGATRLGLGLLKAPAFADVDNLMGGQQRVNLFSTRLPQPDAPAAAWSDARNLPRHAAEVAVEAGSLLKHYLAGPWRGTGSSLVPSGSAVLTRVGDIAHSVMANTFAAVFSTATGPLLGQMLRDGAASARPGENQQSPAYLLQQFSQSATNDFVWQATRSAFKGSAFNLAVSLDRWRETREIKLGQAALQAQGDLPHLAEKLLATPQGRSDSGLQRALRDLQKPSGDAVDTAELQRALGDLKQHVRHTGNNSVEADQLVQCLETALQSTKQREASIRWRTPAGQH